MAINDEHFKSFGETLKKEISKYNYDYTKEGELFKKQKTQFEKLVALEDQFRKELIKHNWGAGIYKKFINLSLLSKDKGGLGNVLATRPYFRERQKTCIGPICKAIKNGNVKKLQQYHINLLFVQFVLEQKEWGKNSKVYQLADAIKKQRHEIIVANFPLNISQARLFWDKAASRDPNQVLSYMDIIQYGAEGLISAIDKYTLPFKTNFRSAIVQWCVGNYIESYSRTLVHFYPKDKKKLYHARKHIRKFVDLDFSEEEKMQRLANKINEEIAPYKTTADEISNLMAASTLISTDGPLPGDNNSTSQAPTYLDKVAVPESNHPDEIYKEEEVQNRLHEAISYLTVFERKLLSLYGVSLT